MSNMINPNKRLSEMRVFKANGKLFPHYRRHKANSRQVNRREFNENLNERIDRFMNIQEASIYNTAFNKGYKEGKKRDKKIIMLLEKRINELLGANSQQSVQTNSPRDRVKSKVVDNPECSVPEDISSQQEVQNHSQQTPVLHSHTEKEKGRKVSEKVVASRIGDNRLPDADTLSIKEVKEQ